ncbi:MAG: cyclic pyranopterin monophosphate synthase MoaC [Turicibacter sp.]|nr:cyclic pyranopterin monophosphate synthase MoaC [Turicibacter sp.]
MSKLTHFNEAGEAVMVDVTEKPVTERIAIAKGNIHVNSEIMAQIKAGSNKKGDVLGVSRLAGIMAVKKTSDLIPLCHPLFISECRIDFELDFEQHMIQAICTVKVDHKTGVEMEALTGVNVALLTIYDMCKAMCKKMTITDVHLAYKSGGKSGEFSYEK